MMTFEVSCGACKATFKADFPEPPESRYVRCPECRAPLWLEVKPKTIAEPGRFARILGLRQ